MTRMMYDGIDPAAVHRKFPNPAMVAGYLDGRYAWTQAEWNLFPHAAHVTITVLGGSTRADVCDCEAGDLTPAHAAQWVRDRKAEGYYRPTIYCSRSVIPAVRQATGNLILGRDYDIWCADYTNTAHQVTAPGSPPATCAATQYLSTGIYDATAVYDNGWPHRTAPKGAPVTSPGFTPAPTGLKDATVIADVRLSWNAVAGQSTYHFQHEHYKDGFGWVLDENVFVDQAVTLHALPAGKHRWRVAAGPKNYIWSAWQEFTV